MTLSAICDVLYRQEQVSQVRKKTRSNNYVLTLQVKFICLFVWLGSEPGFSLPSPMYFLLAMSHLH